MRRVLFTALACAIVSLALMAPAASAAETVSAESSAETGGTGYEPDLGSTEEEPTRQPRKRGRPILTLFRISQSAVYKFGRPATIKYRIRDRSRFVRVRLDFVLAGEERPTYRVRLGRQRTRVVHVYRWRGEDERRFAPKGEYRIRLVARDPEGHILVRSSQAYHGGPITLHGHSFPVEGPHSLGGEDAKFGTRRRGHRHQGHDITAAEGTPVVAPRGGIITWRAYQGDGAGHYLVLAGEGEPYNYVFMHLQSGSLLVKRGDHVQTGQRLASVGSTGASSGPHLHFEIWEGPWFSGGKPIDPLPHLLAWKRGS
jgi:murein DD-endopeptidase MepM/ murein hydrolase activator NlpD